MARSPRSPPLPPNLSSLLPTGHSLLSSTHLSALWAGYGHIFRLILLPSTDASSTAAVQPYSAILKWISPPSPSSQVGYDESNQRKLLSYLVERNFYLHFSEAVRNEGGIHVPQLLASSHEDRGVMLLLEDLSVSYPLLTESRGLLTPTQTDVAISWLARFHAFFAARLSPPPATSVWDTSKWCPPPHPSTIWTGKDGGLWQQGGYTYLATRLDELRSIPRTSRWAKLGLHPDSDLPFAVEWCLQHPKDPRRLTCSHGDVKAANMAFTQPRTDPHPTNPQTRRADAAEVAMAMYDFQYVGLALGVSDLAKFVTTSIPEALLGSHGAGDILRRYYARYIAALAALTGQTEHEAREGYPYRAMEHDWKLALVSWTRFLAGWRGGFWGNTEWLEDTVEAILQDQVWTRSVVERWKREGKGAMPR